MLVNSYAKYSSQRILNKGCSAKQLRGQALHRVLIVSLSLNAQASCSASRKNGFSLVWMTALTLKEL